MTLSDLERLYDERGGHHYGEGVTQIEHAMQCAGLAIAAHASPSLVAAALLHDVGHLLAGEEELAVAGVDDRHEIAGAHALATLFGPGVWRPIALHVAAKRYLCWHEPAYRESLSEASARSLAVQGGTFDAAAAARFERQPYWREAITLRRFDDVGKQEDAAMRSFGDFMPLLRDVARDDPPEPAG